MILCSQCGQKLKEAEDKHICFNCFKFYYVEGYKYVNNSKEENHRPFILKYWIHLCIVLIVIIGCFYTYLFPTPLLLGITSFIWWCSKSSQKIFPRILSDVSLSTGIGLSLLLIIQITLNFISNPASSEIPNWLCSLDNYLIYSKSTLEYVTDISIYSYIAIISFLILVAIKRPRWKPVSKFVDLQGLIAKTKYVILVLTSFTFFTTEALNDTVENIYYEYYKIACMKNTEQKRRSLITDSFRKRLRDIETSILLKNKQKDSENLNNQDLRKIAVNDSVIINEFRRDINNILVKKMNSYNEARKVVELVMSTENTFKAMHTSNDLKSSWGLSDEDLKKKWDQELKKMHDNINKASWLNNKSAEYANPPYSRKTMVEAKIAEVKNENILADQAVEGLKAILANFIGVYIENNNPYNSNLLGKYLEEIVNTSAEYLFDNSGVERIVDHFFCSDREKSKGDLFARIQGFHERIIMNRIVRVEPKTNIPICNNTEVNIALNSNLPFHKYQHPIPGLITRLPAKPIANMTAGEYYRVAIQRLLRLRIR